MSIESYNESVMCINPFFGSKKVNPEDDEEEVSQRNFFKFYKKIYLIMPLQEAKSSWFESNMSLIELDNMLENCLVMEKKNIIAKVNIFFEWIKTVNIEVIKKCKIGSINFDDVETEDVLVLPLFLMPFNNVITFMEMYNEKDWFENFLVQQKLAEYLKVSKNFYEIRNALETSPTTYWCKPKHINVTDLFLQRNFRWNVFKSSVDPSKVKTIEEMKKYKIDNDSYVSMFFKTKGNFDDKFGKVNFSLHRLPKIKKFINQQELNGIMSELSTKNRFQLFFNLLVSPDYCHLVLNNGDLWDMMENVVDRTMPLVRYCLFYSYLSLYLQENIKKSFLRKEDTSILTLSNARKIPNFPYLQSDINSHPAIAAAHLINRKVIPKDNFYGIPCIRDKHNFIKSENTLNDIKTFKDRLNIFISGNSSKNYFSKMDWNNIHITGSVMAACIPNKHPLLNLFHNNIPEGVVNPSDYLHHRYFCEYYSDSDIDILINISNPIKLYERVLKFKLDLEEGIELYENIKPNTTIETIRRGYFKFNQSFIENNLIPYWVKKDVNLTLEDMMENISNQKYAKYFMPFYEEARDDFYKNFIKKTELNSKEFRERYPFFFSKVSSEDIIFNLYQKVENRYYKVETDDLKIISAINENNSKDVPFFEVIESTKYKINHPMINHTFELFGVPHEDPWACINKFHMGSVRAYYDGEEVYMTVSALMSYHTNLSPDYRIMFGSKDPADICNKYRMRGYGIILNKNELAQIITYSENIEFWNNLYHINKKNSSSIKNFLSHKTIDDDLFKPRSFNSNHYNQSTCYVPPIYNTETTKYILDESQLYQELESWCGNKNLLINEMYLKRKYLTSIGKPEQLKRWLIDSGWDMFEMDKIFEE